MCPLNTFKEEGERTYVLLIISFIVIFVLVSNNFIEIMYADKFIVFLVAVK